MIKEKSIEEINKKQLELLEKRLPDADSETLEMLLDDVKSIALNTLYPYEEILPEVLPPKYWNWQLRVCEYLYKHKDTLGIKEYAENEISIVFFSDSLPKSFMNELVPYAGAIRPRPRPIYKEEVEGEDNGL